MPIQQSNQGSEAAPQARVARKAFKYRLYPSKAQATALTGQLREACTLYNAALQERRDAWKGARKSINFFDQCRQLKEIRAEGLTGLANAQCAQDVLHRLEKAFQAFFRRIKTGETPGYPRFKPHRRFDSITFPTHGDGCKLLDTGRLRIQGVGAVKVKLHRPVEGNIKTATIKREAGNWYVAFSVICEVPAPLPASDLATGIDVGLMSFAVLADGTEIKNHRHGRKGRRKLRVAQRRVARRKKGSKGRKKAVVLLQKVHAHVRNQRAEAHHAAANMLVKTFGLIAVEELNIKGLAGGMLAKSVHDAGWGDFFQKLAYKAESAGRLLVEVDPRGTSQRCSSAVEACPRG